MRVSPRQHFTKMEFHRDNTSEIGSSIYLCFAFFFTITFFYLALLSFVVVTQIRGHMAGSSSPSSPLRQAPCVSIARRLQPFVLASPTRVELGLPTLGVLSFSFLFLQLNSESHHGGIRTHGPTLLMVAFAGYCCYSH